MIDLGRVETHSSADACKLRKSSQESHVPSLLVNERVTNLIAFIRQHL